MYTKYLLTLFLQLQELFYLMYLLCVEYGDETEVLCRGLISVFHYDLPDNCIQLVRDFPIAFVFYTEGFMCLALRMSGGDE